MFGNDNPQEQTREAVSDGDPLAESYESHEASKLAIGEFEGHGVKVTVGHKREGDDEAWELTATVNHADDDFELPDGWLGRQSQTVTRYYHARYDAVAVLEKLVHDYDLEILK